jgi:hypothetical protein
MVNQCQRRYESQLTKALSAINDIIQPQTTVAHINDNAASPWKTKVILEIYVPIVTKTQTAKQHKEHPQSTLQHKNHLCFYTDGFLLERRARTGVNAF